MYENGGGEKKSQAEKSTIQRIRRQLELVDRARERMGTVRLMKICERIPHSMQKKAKEIVGVTALSHIGETRDFSPDRLLYPWSLAGRLLSVLYPQREKNDASNS